MRVCIRSVRRIIDAAGCIWHPSRFDNETFRQGRALVTGSAREAWVGKSSGLLRGRAPGSRSAISAQSDVDEAVAKLGLPPARVLGIKADVTSERDVNDLFAERSRNLPAWTFSSITPASPGRAADRSISSFAETPLRCLAQSSRHQPQWDVLM